MAWIDTQKLIGPDPRQWQWGKLHHSLIEHPFAAAVDGPLRDKLNVGPFAKSGGSHTPNMSSYDPRNFRQVGGPSFRVVLDVGNWDNSRAINTPGQSGDPDSPHYRDLAPMWLRGDYFPLLYSKKQIAAATVQRIVLQPQ
jgi:penicillin amidase